ncbi:MAG: ABC transporter ATP-binding protein [Acidobacteria bacterium]|nr:ABC transporter ATP-binding protein [Acidobacteriota bacterium]
MALNIKNLFKKYGDKWIIRNVSLEVNRGEVLGIYGAVGAGKSTLLRAIAGKVGNDGGAVFFDADDVKNLNCEERRFHFQSVTNDALRQTNFQAKEQAASEMSEGVGQVVALEKALQIADKVLLLDNQFCFMDRETRDENCRKLRRTVEEKNLAVIFATNDYSEIFSVCDRVAVLHDGEIQQTGTPRDVYENPRTAHVARLTGRNNLIKAKIIKNENADALAFETMAGEHRIYSDRLALQHPDVSDGNFMLAIRPEHVSISFGASFPEDNLLRARITDIRFRGATTVVELDADSLILQALVLRFVGLNVGEECMVGLPPDRILVFSD